MKLLLLVFFTLITSAVHADINYSGIWKDTKEKYYSIHQLADSLVVAKLSSHKEELSPFEQGNLIFTDNPLDLAISGHGFFIIELDDGSHIYTRKGNFRIDADRRIVNEQGEKLVMEKGGALPVDDFVGFVVDDDGTINLQTPEDKLIKFDRIKLASIEPKDLRYYSNIKMTVTNEDAVTYFNPMEKNGGAIQQGMLEMLSWTAQNWTAYTGKLIDNHANINRISEDKNMVFSKVITFNSESTANLAPLKSTQALSQLLMEEEIRLIKVF